MEEVKIPITLDDSGFGTGAKRIIDRMEDTQKEVNKTGMSVDYFAKHMQNVYRHFDKLTAAVHENTAAIGKDSQATRQLGRDFDETANKGVSGFGRLEKAAIGFFTIQKAKEFVGNVYEVRSEIEKLETSFRILVGDKAKADALFASIRKFAVETPMQLKDLAGAVQTMMGFGIATEDVMANLEALGNVSMGDSQKFQSLALAFSQMSATGKLMGQDLLQMINAGFNPLDQMAKTTGKSIAELKEEMSQGAISADMVRQAFIDATSEGGKFNGMLEAQSKTLAGAYSNLEGAVDDMLNEIGQKSEGAFATAIEGATDLVKNYDKVASVIQDLIVAYGSYKAALMVCNAVEKASVGIKQAMAVQEALLTAEAKKLAAARGISLAAAKAELGGVNLLTVAKIRLTAATKSLTAAMMANPYVLVSMAVAGLCFGIYKLATAEDAETAARRRANEEMKTFQNQLDEQKNKIQGYIQTIQDETATEYQKAEAWEMLNKMAPTLTEKYDKAAMATLDLAEATKELNEQADKANYEHIRDEVQKWKETIDRINQNMLDDARYTGGKNALFNLQQLKGAEAQLDTYLKKLAEIDRIRAKMAEDAKPLEIRIKEANENVHAKQSIYDFYKRAADLAGELKNAHDEAAGVIANSGIPYNYEAIADQTKEKYDALIAELEADVEDLRTRIAESPASLELEQELKGKEKALDDLISMKQQWAWSGATTIPLNFVMNFSQVETALQNAKSGQGINTQGMRFNGPTGTWVKDEATAPATMTASQWRKDAYNNWKQAQAAVDAFWNKKEEMDKATFDKEYKSLKDAADQAKKDYDKLKGSTNGNSSAARKAAETARKHQAYLDLIEKQRVEQERAVTDMEFSTEQATIDAMQDGAEKTLRQLKLDHEKRKEEIEREYADLKQAKIDAAKQLFEANPANNGKVFDASSVDTSYSEKEQANYRALMEANNATYRRALEDRQRMEAQSMRDFLKEYGNYQQQRQAIAQEYARKIQEAETIGEKMSLQARMEKELDAIDGKDLAERLNFEDVFNNLEVLTVERMKSIRDELRSQLSSSDLGFDEYKVLAEQIDKINTSILDKEERESEFLGFRIPGERTVKRLKEEQAEAMRNALAVQTALTDATLEMEEKRGVVADLLSGNGIDYKGEITAANSQEILNSLGLNPALRKKVESALLELNAAENKVTETTKKKEKADNKVVTSTQEVEEAQKNLRERVAEFAKSFEQINANLQSLPDLANVLGFGVSKEMQQGLDGINDVMGGMADFASGNYVGAAFKAASAVKNLGQAFGIIGGASNHEEMLARQEEYNKALDASSAAIDHFTQEVEKSYGALAIQNAGRAEDIIKQSMQTIVNGIDSVLSDNYGGGHIDYWHANKALNRTDSALYGAGIFDWLREFGINAYEAGEGKNTWQQIFRNDPEKLASMFRKMRDEGSDAWRVITTQMGYNGGALEEWIEKLISAYDQLDETADLAKERLTTTTSENVFDDFLSSLYDLADGSEDVTENIAENWQKMVNRMVINNLVIEDFREDLKGWYDDLADLNRELADGLIDNDTYSERLEGLSKRYDDMLGDAQDKMEDFRKSGIIKPVSEATEEVGAYFDNLRDRWLSTLTDMTQSGEDWRKSLMETMFSDLVEATVLNVPLTVTLDGEEKAFDDFQAYLDNWTERYKAVLENQTLTDEERNRQLRALLDEQTDIREKQAEKSRQIAEGIGIEIKDEFSNSLDNLGGTMLDALLGSEEDAAATGRKVAMSLIQEMMKTMLASDRYARQMEDIRERWQQVLTGRNLDEAGNELFTMADVLRDISALNDEIANDGAIAALAEQYKALEDASKKVESSFGDLHGTFMDAITDMESGAENLGKKLRDTLTKDLIEKKVFEIPVTMTIDGEERVFDNFDAYQENWTERYLDALDSGDEALLDALTRELGEREDAMAKSAEKYVRRLQETVKDTTFTDMEGDFVSALMDMDGDIDDFANGMKRTIVQRLVESFMVSEKIKPLLEDLQATFDAVMGMESLTLEERARMLSEGFERDGKMFRGISDVTDADGMKAWKDTVAAALDAAGFKAEEAATAFDDLSDRIASALTGYDTSDNFVKGLTETVISEFTAAFMATDEFKERLKEVKDGLAAAAESGDTQMIRDAENAARALFDEVEEGTRSIRELGRESDTTFSGMADDWISTLMDLEATAEDWAEDIGRTMARKIIEQMVAANMIQPLLDNLQDAFNEAMSAEGATWQTVLPQLAPYIDELKGAFGDLQPIVEQILNAFGIFREEVEEEAKEGFGDLRGTFVSSLMDMEADAEKFGRDIARAMTEQMVSSIIEKQFGEQLAAINEAWFNALEAGDTEAMERIRQQLIELQKLCGEAVQPLLDSLAQIEYVPEEVEEEIDETITSMRDDFLNALMDMKAGTAYFVNDIKKLLTRKLVEKFVLNSAFDSWIEGIQSQYDAIFNGSMSEEQAAAAMNKLAVEWEAKAKEMQEQTQAIFDLTGWSAIVEQMNSPLGDLRSSFRSALMDMENDTEDFANEISKLLTEAFIDKFVLGDEFDKRLAEWQEQYAAIMKGNYSEEERASLLKQLQQAIAAAKEGYAEEAQAIHDLMGTGNASDQTATMNMADKATYDQFETYLGIAVAQQMATLQGNDVREQILATLRGMTGITSPGGDTVKEIRSLLNTSNEYLLDIKRTNRAILEQFGMKIDNIISKLTKLV